MRATIDARRVIHTFLLQEQSWLCLSVTLFSWWSNDQPVHCNVSTTFPEYRDLSVTLSGHEVYLILELQKLVSGDRRVIFRSII